MTTTPHPLPDVPADFEVRPLGPDDPAVDRVTCGTEPVVPHYHANAHQPGYLPMADDVPTFATAGAAWEWVAGELERDWDQAVDGAEPGEDVDGRYLGAHATVHNGPDGPGAVHVDGPTDTHLGMVYEVTVCTEDHADEPWVDGGAVVTAPARPPGPGASARVHRHPAPPAERHPPGRILTTGSHAMTTPPSPPHAHPTVDDVTSDASWVLAGQVFPTEAWVGDGGPGLEMRGYASGLANAMIAAVEVATGTGYADPITDEGLALVGAMVRVIRAVTAPREVVPPATDQSDVVDIVTARGAEDGRTAAGLVFDGHTTEDTYRAVLTGLEDGDPAVVDPLPSPTVTAGELAEWLAERTGLPADTFDGQRVEETYEAAFSEGLAWEVERVARYHLYPPDGSISHGQARVIASEWHGGQASPLYALASSGAVDLDRVVTEVDMCLAAADSAEDMRLRALRRYVRTCGSRGPVRGWSDLWDESPVSEDQADEAAL